MNHHLSKAYQEEAAHYIPGGVNSPVRAFKNVGGTPPVIKSGKGAWLTDIDGNRYIDYVCSWGALPLGHANDEVIRFVSEVIQQGTSFGAPCELELQLAKLICELMPSIKKIRFVNSGTEATMTAVRLARAFTQRRLIIKFEGCYHGHSDALLVKAGSGGLTFGIPNSAGIPDGATEDTLVASFNDIDSVKELFEDYGEHIAGVIVEPIAGNMNFVMSKANFLYGLRELCNQYNSVLIFDEVMTGFRIGLDGAQGMYSITPDLTTLGKVIGGGMPVAAVGGKAEIMEQLAPIGNVYQAGTLSGNPVCMAAGIATLQQVKQNDFFENLASKVKKLKLGLEQAAAKNNIDFSIFGLCGMMGFYFRKELPTSYAEIMQCNTEHFKQFFHGMLEHGVYLAPSPFEAGFISSAHGDLEIEQTIRAAEAVFSTLKK